MKALAWITGLVLLAGSLFTVPARAQESAGRAETGKSVRRLANKEAIAPDIKPESLWDGRKLMPFRAEDSPKMARANAANFLDDNEYVLGLTINGESRAYPTRYAAFHHVINDKVGKPEQGGPEFVTVTYCVVCNSGVRFNPIANGHPLKFEFYGIYNGVVTMYDRNTKSVWLQVGGRAIKGPMLGTELKTGPLLDTTWGQWKTLHPDTLVMLPDERYSDYYEPKGAPMPRGFSSFPGDYFPKSITHRDNRLPTFASILAVALPQSSPDVATTGAAQKCKKETFLYRAYPLKTLKVSSGSINDRMGTLPVAVFFEPKSATATAFSRILDGQTLTFEARKQANGKRAFYDKETGTRWNIEGKAECGPLAGLSLQRLDSHMSLWYGWVAYFPQTTIYRCADTPQLAKFSKLSHSRLPGKLAQRN